jgi:predicted phage baseplate assembly protein
MSDNPCACSGHVFPWLVSNPPAQSSLAYRWGDYDAFRAALLLPRADETQLTTPDGRLIWRPAPDGDLALQIVEWWAYLADILTLYTELAANQAYVRTADLPESLLRLVPILGYRPRPAIGAQLTLAGLVRGPRPVTLPRGLQVQSKPGPGAQPQVFELNSATTIEPVAPIAALPQTTLMPAPVTAGQKPAPPGAWQNPGSGTPISQVLLAGKPSGLKLGTEVLLLATGWTGQKAAWAVGNVSSLTPSGPNTTVDLVFTALGGGASGISGAANWRLLKASRSSSLYPYLGASLVPFGGLPGPIPTLTGEYYVELASVARDVAPGDIMLLDNPGGAAGGTIAPGYVTATGEIVYYANNPTAPTVWPPAPSPPNTTTPAVPIPHTVVAYNGPAAPAGDPANLVVRYGYSDVGKLIDVPVTDATQVGSLTLDPTALPAGGLSSGSMLLVTDANNDGAAATAGTGGAVTVDAAAPPLVPPLRALTNLLNFTRGKTVPREVLGDGNAAVAEQDFTLKNKPVTYLAAQPGISGPGYSSTITLWVDGVQWQEVSSFYGQTPGAQVFTTYEDTNGNTHVLSGDGAQGARFPTGSGNIVATYRTGSGAALPPPTSVTVLLQPQPGLRGVMNPLPPFGGADADSPAALARLAPQSVLTFGRAVSLDDYAAVAAATPGVARVSAAYIFDPIQQRPVVTLWVGDDPQAVTAAQEAILPIADPNRPISIKLATPVPLTISLTYVRDPRYQDATVRAAVRAALLDPDQGLFGADVVQIGQAFYGSQVYQTCLAVPGVQAVHGLTVTLTPPPTAFWTTLQVIARPKGRRPLPHRAHTCQGHRYDPGNDGYVMLTDAALTATGLLGS